MCKLKGRTLTIHGDTETPRRVVVTANYINDPCVIIRFKTGGTLGIHPSEADQLVADLKEALRALREE
ncbi:hypothetical protein HOV23_gp092 [Pseudomonas phage Lana]|uniref:Uncharacterized protein n=1 Tax=Pseudomonas phage Lana TaxID=2530172 RepID=A0A481W5W4_9CAUD|nr:hypothetical protein HOV23_gp092 [Pseudomonas phage Lana]QBJ04481.1 hypothetical protein [Pseudomonas phage Lana]